MGKRKNSRAKGANGERELSKRLNELFGTEARRGQQFSGLEGKDVVGLPGIHVESKRVEKLNIHDAVEQAIGDAKAGEVPAVFHRKNHYDWLVTLRLTDVEAFVSAFVKIIADRPAINPDLNNE